MASVSWLSVDGETFYEKAEMPTLLAMSRLILSSAQERTLVGVSWCRPSDQSYSTGPNSGNLIPFLALGNLGVAIHLHTPVYGRLELPESQVSGYGLYQFFDFCCWP